MNDKQLQLALANMLPDKIYDHEGQIFWNNGQAYDEEICCPVLDSEMLHVCWLALSSFSIKECQRYNSEKLTLHDSWQRHAEVLCKVKGITA